MPQIQRDSLLTLEAYSRSRDAFRKQVMAHKRHRRVPLGNNVMLIFEDELTIRYQIQEMLRAEKIFEEDEIRHELETYNPLVPDGRNWKATMMIEYPDVEERKRALAKLKGIEDRVYVQVEGSPRVYAVADEDLERENDEKTSSVHFLRFELTEDMAKALKYGVSLAIGVDHPSYAAALDPVPAEMRSALVADLA
ncbi:MAG: DUF3501 family protein [Burkholderiales bacterium]|jgi:hypothetical protein|nr:DUF3501 family protein [Burkholderiales bacterium]